MREVYKLVRRLVVPYNAELGPEARGFEVLDHDAGDPGAELYAGAHRIRRHFAGERLHDPRLEHGIVPAHDVFHGVGREHRAAVGPVRDERVVYIRYADDPAEDMDVLGGEAVGVAQAVELLMVGKHGGLGVLRYVGVGAHVPEPLEGMLLDLLKLLERELACLVDDLLIDKYLADIVYQRAHRKVVQRLLVHAQNGAKHDGEYGYVDAVGVGIVVVGGGGRRYSP